MFDWITFREGYGKFKKIEFFCRYSTLKLMRNGNESTTEFVFNTFAFILKIRRIYGIR